MNIQTLNPSNPQTVEVTVSWGTSILQVFHVDNNQEFVLGLNQILFRLTQN